MSKNTEVTTAFMKIVKKMREDKKLTLEQLADLAGVHRTTIGLLERRERTPTLQIATQIADALDISLSKLIHQAELIGLCEDHPLTSSLVGNCIDRKPNMINIRNEDKLVSITGIDAKMLLNTINSCYQTLDIIDEQLVSKNVAPVAQLVELANLSSMIGNIVVGEIANYSRGLYLKNKPHTYPDLLAQKAPAVDLELKMALEQNRPKGHLPKAGTYITFRYILGNKQGKYIKGKENRGNTVWIWEVKVGNLTEESFSCSNTVGDSGKTAVIKTDVYNKMHLIYYVPEHAPYTLKSNRYDGFN